MTHLPPHQTPHKPGQAIVLLGHGSRDPAWRTPIDNIARRMLELAPNCQVHCAFLELMAPDLASVTADLVALGIRQISILPMFLGLGRHARDDLPVLLEQLRQHDPEVLFQLLPSVGEHPQVIELLAKIGLSGD